MPRWLKCLSLLATLACLIGLLVHVSSDPCHWQSDWTHRAPGKGSGSAPSGHGCHGCLSASWAMISLPPGLAAVLLTASLEAEPTPAFSESRQTELSSPRAPPSV